MSNMQAIGRLELPGNSLPGLATARDSGFAWTSVTAPGADSALLFDPRAGGTISLTVRQVFSAQLAFVLMGIRQIGD
jgi:hypothetical protein